MRRILAALTAFSLLLLCSPISGASASSKYYITVDITNQIVTIYDSEDTSEINIVRQMICSTGRNATPTPQGTWHLPSRGSSERSEWYYFPKFKCYAKWATRITGGILFHSTLFSASKKGPTRGSTRALGSKASHGCVRLRVNDAKFIAENCLAGTKCRIFSSGKRNNSLRSKLKKKTFIRDKQTYDNFLGRTPTESPLPLSKGSTGSLVTQLQTRLKELGFYNGEVNASMDKSTVAAVKSFQAASGIRATGSVDQALWDTVFGEHAATGTMVTLAEGSTGPVVTALQSNLTTLLMFSGAIDGNFTADTTAAVKTFQTAYGYTATGQADGDLQSDIATRAAQVRQDFGSNPYTMTNVTKDVKMAKVKASSGVKLRKTASKKGKSLKKLKKKTAVRVISNGKTWTKVRFGDLTGYVKRSSLKFYTETITENGYVAAEAGTGTATDTTAPVTTESSDPTVAAEAEETLTAESLVSAESAALEIAPEGTDEVLIYGTEPVEDDEETPENESGDMLDNGLEIEPEPVDAPDPEPSDESDGGLIEGVEDETGIDDESETGDEPDIVPGDASPETEPETIPPEDDLAALEPSED